MYMNMYTFIYRFKYLAFEADRTYCLCDQISFDEMVRASSIYICVSFYIYTSI